MKTLIAKKLRYIIALSAIAMLITFTLPITSASAAIDTCTWTGLDVDDALWTSAGNWSCSTDGIAAPEDDDTLVFPAGTIPRKTNVNDFVAGKDFDNILISGNDYIITGNAIVLSPVSTTFLQLTGSNIDFGLNTTLTKSGASGGLASSGTTNEISGDIILNITAGADMNVGVSGTNELTFSGIISGTTQSFIISGDTGTAIYSGISTFTATGTMQINPGAGAVCGANDCLGIAANNLSISGNSVLLLNTTSAIENDITFAAGDPGSILGILNNAAIDGNIVLNNEASILAATSTALLVNGDVNLNAFTATYGGPSGSQIVHNGVISGTGDVVIDGTVQMINPNSYSGSTTINAAATLVASDTGSLGSDAGDTTINSGGTLQYNPFADVSDAEDISVEGVGDAGSSGAIELFNAGFDVNLSGTITLTGATVIANNANTSDITFSGNITGNGNLTLIGDAVNGGFDINGTTANDYVGTTTFNSVFVAIDKPNNVNAIPGDLEIIGDVRDASLFLGDNDENIADDATITMDSGTSDAFFEVQGSITETLGIIKGNGTMLLGNNTPIINVGGDNESGVFTGDIFSNEAEIEKIGTGTWDLQGTNSGAGNFSIYRVSAGKLLLNFSDTSGQFSPFTVNGGSLGGTDVIGPLTVSSGSVAPGNSPGCLNPDGPLTFSSGSSLNVEITGSTICTHYDKVAASGAVTLGNATLNITLSYTPTVGTVFTIVEGSSVSGTFNGIANGATVSSGGNLFTVNYNATNVTLTTTSAPATVIPAAGTLPTTGTSIAIAFIALLLIAGGLVLNSRRKNRLQLVK